MEIKKEFKERIKKLMPDYERFFSYFEKYPLKSIRCNTIKISPRKLKEKLEEKEWRIKQPFSKHPEIMVVENKLSPGDLGKTREHSLGYYYIQGIESMMPILALQPKPDELLLDLTAAPGSKTTQASAMMKNSGTIIANDFKIERIKALISNIERCGCSNCIVTRHDAVILCKKLKKLGIRFDKILIDPSCSGEGTFHRPENLRNWQIGRIKTYSWQQKKISASSIDLLRENGTLVYSTCTYAPEENEEVVDFLIKKFNLELESVKLPLKVREGVEGWEGKKFSDEVRRCIRIYPQDNNTEGFFLAKLRKIK